MELETILNKVTETQKDRHCMVALISGSYFQTFREKHITWNNCKYQQSHQRAWWDKEVEHRCYEREAGIMGMGQNYLQRAT